VAYFTASVAFIRVHRENLIITMSGRKSLFVRILYKSIISLYKSIDYARTILLSQLTSVLSALNNIVRKWVACRQLPFVTDIDILLEIDSI
jgi:hypothetical protein